MSLTVFRMMSLLVAIILLLAFCLVFNVNTTEACAFVAFILAIDMHVLRRIGIWIMKEQEKFNDRRTE